MTFSPSSVSSCLRGDIRFSLWGLSLLMLAAGTTAMRAGPASGAPPSAVPATQVITFRPAVPTGKRRSGDCWTESIAVDRPEAWRCAAGNAIYDPCFTVADLPNAVV